MQYLDCMWVIKPNRPVRLFMFGFPWIHMDSLVHLDSLRPKSHDLRVLRLTVSAEAQSQEFMSRVRDGALCHLDGTKKGATEKQIETISKLGIVHIHVTRLSETLRDSPRLSETLEAFESTMASYGIHATIHGQGCLQT